MASKRKALIFMSEFIALLLFGCSIQCSYGQGKVLMFVFKCFISMMYCQILSPQISDMCSKSSKPYGKFVVDSSTSIQTMAVLA